MVNGLLLAFFAGAFGVLQNTLNRRFAPELSLPFAILINGICLFSLSAAFFLALALLPATSLPDWLRPRMGLAGLSLRHLLPGLLGFAIIVMLPPVIGRLGATRVFLVVVAAQILASLAWDRYVENLSASTWRYAGCLLAMLGALLSGF